MATEEFEKNLETLMELAERKRIALMCVEVIPWKCHRIVLSDALIANGFEVLHILGKSSPKKHTIAKWPKVDGKRLTCPLENQTLFL